MRRGPSYKHYIFLLAVVALVLNLLWSFAPMPPITQLWEPAAEGYNGPLNICDVAIGITTTGKYKDRTDMQEKTWLKEMCPKKSNFRFITDQNNSTNSNAVYSTCPTDYNSVCCKTADLVHKMYAIFPTKKWFMKCDDDSYIVPDRLLEFLSTLNHSEPILTGLPYYVVLKNMCTIPRTRHNCTAGSARPHIGGELGYTAEDNFAYPAGGPCYAFSNELARRMVAYDFVANYNKFCNNETPFEDYMISRVASEVGGYFVSGSAYFTSGSAKAESVKHEQACCYHMTKKEWCNMDKVYKALKPRSDQV